MKKVTGIVLIVLGTLLFVACVVVGNVTALEPGRDFGAVVALDSGLAGLLIFIGVMVLSVERP